MFFIAYPSPKMSWIQSQIHKKDGLSALSPLYSSSPSSSGTRISPAVIVIIAILALIFFISSLLNLLVRYLMKQQSSSSPSQSNRPQEMSDSDTFHGQLQQLFHLHASGLDQAFIDALPIFLYKQIMGLKNHFDCAICLSEFSQEDKLRLLPICSHAFHISCIDTWLLSSSSCPICRGSLFTPGLPLKTPILNFDDLRQEDGLQGDGENGFFSDPKPLEIEVVLGEKRVFSVKLGKFKSVINGEGEGQAEGSSSNLDARRCYSMGSLQYVVGESNLQVTLCSDRDVNVKGSGGGQNGNCLVHGDMEGKKLSRNRGESFSVSKIWLWSKKEKLPSSHNVELPWMNI